MRTGALKPDILEAQCVVSCSDSEEERIGLRPSSRHWKLIWAAQQFDFPSIHQFLDQKGPQGGAGDEGVARGDGQGARGGPRPPARAASGEELS